MIEKLLEKFFGGVADDDTSPAIAPQINTLSPLDPSTGSEEFERVRVALLREQIDMLRLQKANMREQRLLILRHLQFRRIREMSVLTSHALFSFAGFTLALVVLAMLVGAMSSRSVVIHVFDVPPALAQRGISGKVVATLVLDELQKLQSATRATSKGLDTHSAWSNDITIVVPQTGVSVGEIERLLHDRLGSDLHIEGDLVQDDAAHLTLTVRGDGVLARRFSGGAADIGTLTRRAAEYIYGRSQPRHFATYLIDSGRNEDALAFLPEAFARAENDAARAKLANSWGNLLSGMNRPAEAVKKYRLALTLQPNNWGAWGNLVGAVGSAEGQEAAWREAQAMLKAAARAPFWRRPSARDLNNVAGTTQDWPLLLESLREDAAHNEGAGADAEIDAPQFAEAYALLHDDAQAQRYITLADPADPTTQAETQMLAIYEALEHGNPAAAVAPARAFWTAWLANTDMQYTFSDGPCYVGLVLGLTGNTKDAVAVFERARSAAVLCDAMHGDVLDQQGDVAGAERIWAEGLHAGPDLSPVYLHRGLSELRHGALAAAAADLEAAHVRSPHWADPLKAWGDVLARQGRWREALARYDEALEYAPAWQALQQARDEASRHAA